MKGLLVWVYRNNSFGDCSANGISSRHDSFILCGEDVDEIFEVKDCTPALMLVKRELQHTNDKKGEYYIHAVPVINGKLKINGMFGGNFVYSNDSRFPSYSPIPIHDRFEN